MRITLINGSPAKQSKTFALLEYLENLLQKNGVETTLWDLRVKPLPIVMPEYHKNPIETPNETVKEFVQLIENADGLILGTPLYHGSYSGVLKNAIDNLAYDAFRNKIIGVVSSSGGTKNAQACEHLSSVVRTLYGYIAQTVVATDHDDYEKIKNTYVVTNTDIKKRCNRLIDELIHLCTLHSKYKIM